MNVMVYNNFPGNGKGWWVLNILPHISLTRIEDSDDVDVPEDLGDSVSTGDTIFVLGWLFWEIFTIFKIKKINE